MCCCVYAMFVSRQWENIRTLHRYQDRFVPEIHGVILKDQLESMELHQQNLSWYFIALQDSLFTPVRLPSIFFYRLQDESEDFYSPTAQ